MESSVRERRTGALVAVGALVIGLSTLWSLPLLLLIYLLARKAMPLFVREVFLRTLDLYLSMGIFYGAGCLLVFAVGTVASDGDLRWLRVFNLGLAALVVVLPFGYGVVSQLFLAFHAWRGRLHDPKCSMGILQALRGRPRVTVA